MAWLYYGLGRRKRDTYDWAIGVDEMASMIYHLARSVPRSFTVSFLRHDFYTFEYDWQLPPYRSDRALLFSRFLRGPALFARLARQSRGFVYVGSNGYLIENVDGRAWEFEFLKRRDKRIVAYFVGDDIRAPRLLEQFGRERGLRTVADQIGLVDNHFLTDTYDLEKRMLAASADAMADVIFSAKTDQMSYLTRDTLPVIYFYPDEKFGSIDSKFDDDRELVVVHAPSSPHLKGTDLVREAVDRLKAEGVQFEYVELMGVANDVVLAELARAHIVLNQFYAYLPGVFGIESLAAGCAVMMSADERLETDLPAGSNSAWKVTRSTEIYENLKALLGDRRGAHELARRGQEWAHRWAAESQSEPRLRAVLDSVLDTEQSL